MDRPVFIEAERLAAFKPRGADVDVVLDLMIHDLDLACALARAEPTDLSACGFRVLTRDIDIANARLEFANGCVANLSASRVSQSPVRKLRVFQADMYASADLQAARLRYVREVGGNITETDETYEGGDALADQAAAFAAAVQGTEPVQVDGREGRRVLELALDGRAPGARAAAAFPMKLAFTKMQGAGNDFVVLDAPREPFDLARRAAAAPRRPALRRRLRPDAGGRAAPRRRRRFPLPHLQRRRRRGRAVRQRRALLRAFVRERGPDRTSARSASRRSAASSRRGSRTTAR